MNYFLIDNFTDVHSISLQKGPSYALTSTSHRIVISSSPLKPAPLESSLEGKGGGGGGVVIGVFKNAHFEILFWFIFLLLPTPIKKPTN